MASNVDEEASAEPVPKSNCGAGQVAVGVQSSSVRLGALPLTGIRGALKVRGVHMKAYVVVFAEVLIVDGPVSCVSCFMVA